MLIVPRHLQMSFEEDMGPLVRDENYAAYDDLDSTRSNDEIDDTLTQYSNVPASQLEVIMIAPQTNLSLARIEPPPGCKPLPIMIFTCQQTLRTAFFAVVSTVNKFLQNCGKITPSLRAELLDARVTMKYSEIGDRLTDTNQYFEHRHTPATPWSVRPEPLRQLVQADSHGSPPAETHSRGIKTLPSSHRQVPALQPRTPEILSDFSAHERSPPQPRTTQPVTFDRNAAAFRQSVLDTGHAMQRHRLSHTKD